MAESGKRPEPTEARTPEPARSGGSAPSGIGTALPLPLETPAFVIPDLPWAYQDDRLVLLVRDPRTLYAYWDCHPDTLSAARAEVPDGAVVLRLLLMGGSERKVLREFPVDVSWLSYYFYDLDPNHDYRVELALKSPGGAERLILKPSNVATLPANQPSAWIEDRMASIPLEIPLPPAALFLSGRTITDSERRLHSRSYQLSLGPHPITGDQASSAQGILEGFGGRSWSGTLVRK